VDTRDVAYLGRKAKVAQAAKDAAATAQLTSDNRRVGIINDRDDVVSGGGWRGHLYDQTGLRPSQQDAGALLMLKRGQLQGRQFASFLSEPEKLIAGNAGNAIVDRLKSMADAGELERDADWSPPSTVSGLPAVDASGAPIRNVEAYRASALGNQQRITDAIAAVRDHPQLQPDTKLQLGEALGKLGSTGSSEDAKAITADALNGLTKSEKAQALAILTPITAAIKR
jgi:hypothetical protein